MGYDLHITRRKRWSDAGHDITPDEWLGYVRSDCELHLEPDIGRCFAIWTGPSQLDKPWLDWAKGQIYTKYPDPAVITKMIAIARQLGATVQGDDGEIYRSGTDAPQQPRLSFRDRIGAWLRSRFRRSRSLPPQSSPSFRVGDRVRDYWGNTHTVIEVDPGAMHGMGIIRTRSDEKGSELGHSMRAHGLALVDETHHDVV